MATQHGNLVILHDTAHYATKRWILSFGWGGALTHVLVWADSLDSAIETAVDDYIADNAPGVLADDDEVTAAYAQAIEDGESEESARETAESDLYPLDQGLWLHNAAWYIGAEDPDRATIARFKGE
jgi:hypothetical protein